MVVPNHQGLTLLAAELLLLRLHEEEVVVERLLRVLYEQEEVPQLLARLLVPLAPSGLFLMASLWSARWCSCAGGTFCPVGRRYLFSVAGCGIAGSAAKAGSFQL